MVSTRGLRYKFSEGERVLCYEPDPTKAKVLYDSKVLEVIESKDKRGRRTVEYLIHFQGWNSSWDRCVSEDFVLKDTEENRQLQRDLAEKSQLQLGAYLYRRERKKGSGSSGTAAGTGPGKRVRTGFSDDGSSSSTQPEEGETGDTDSSSGDGSGSQPQSPPPSATGRGQITLPAQLRDRLTFDYHLVVKRGKLLRLPATPSAAEILESFVKWFARAGAWHPQRGRHDPPQRPDLMDVSCRLNLVREVADGLRVYFDFVLRGHLLYKQELNQYHEVCGQYLLKQEEAEMQTQVGALNQEKALVETDLKSPKIPEYSHLPPDPSDVDHNGGTPQGKSMENLKIEEPVKPEANDMPAPVPAPKPEPSSSEEVQSPAGASAATSAAPPVPGPAPAPVKQRESRVLTRSGNLARRLRSHKSAVSQSENEEPAPSTSTGDPRTFETLSSSLGSSGSSLSECWSRPGQGAATAPSTTRTPLSLLLEKVTNWELISRDSTSYLPCRIYGAVHLARLFVKLPEFLNATSMPDYKLKLILKHIDMFVQYLDEHSEWFGESYYIADSTSRSH